MAELNSSEIQLLQGIQFPEKEALKESTVDIPVTDILQCFVCDVKIQGRHYSLATCRTQTTKNRVIEKLGELVGEKYVVVIAEDDVICRSCANLINTLDRLHFEIQGVKNTVLQYLECKYNLEEGELVNNNKRKNCQQVHDAKGDGNNKRKTVDLLDESVSESKKKPIWLQCDKCRYTTHYNTFMVHHIRQHINLKINCDRCGVQFVANNQQNSSHNCKDNQNRTDSSTQNISVDESTESRVKSLNSSYLENDNLVDIELHSLVTDQQGLNVLVKEDVGEGEIDLPSSVIQTERVESKDVSSNGQQEYPIEQENETEKLDNKDLVRDLVLGSTDASTKQILTVAEDGSLEMIEINTWQEKNTNYEKNES